MNRIKRSILGLCHHLHHVAREGRYRDVFWLGLRGLRWVPSIVETPICLGRKTLQDLERRLSAGVCFRYAWDA